MRAMEPYAPVATLPQPPACPTSAASGGGAGNPPSPQKHLGKGRGELRTGRGGSGRLRSPHRAAGPERGHRDVRGGRRKTLTLPKASPACSPGLLLRFWEGRG